MDDRLLSQGCYSGKDNLVLKFGIVHNMHCISWHLAQFGINTVFRSV